MSAPTRKNASAKPVIVPLSIVASGVTLQGASSEARRQVPEGLRGRRKDRTAGKTWGVGLGKNLHRASPRWTGEGARPHMTIASVARRSIHRQRKILNH